MCEEEVAESCEKEQHRGCSYVRSENVEAKVALRICGVRNHDMCHDKGEGNVYTWFESI